MQQTGKPQDATAMERHGDAPRRMPGEHNLHCKDLQERGVCIIENALTEDEIGLLLPRLKEQSEAELAQGVTHFGSPEQPDEAITQWVALLPNKGKCFVDLSQVPSVYALARHFIGEACVVTDLSARITRPGSAAMGLHTDQWWLPEPAMPDEPGVRVASMTRSNGPTAKCFPANRPINPMVVMTVLFALEDITSEMGPTRFVPGSHLSGGLPDPRETYPEIVPEVRRGSAVVFDGRIWHGAAPNQSDKPRFTVLIGYTGPQFRAILNLPYGLKPEVAASLSDEQRSLFGYKVWNGYGATEDYSAEFATPQHENTGILKP